MEVFEFFTMDEQGVNRNPSIVFPFIVFSLLSIAAIWPPVEFVSAGATFENLFWRYIGDVSHNAVLYQCRKILVNRCCLAILPVLFAFFILQNFYLTVALKAYVIVTISIAIFAMAYAFYTIKTNFANTRQMKELSLYGGDIYRLMTEITAEYMEFANFAVSFAHSSKLVVGNRWLINISRFDFTIVHINDVVFDAVKSNSIVVSSHDLLQFLTIQARVPTKKIQTFTFRIRSDQLRDLEDRLASRIRMARSIVIHQSLNERFVVAFIDCISKNKKYVYADMANLENCFGCGSEIPDVKIWHKCDRDSEFNSPCRGCYCRPMWCVACLARIFAAKQESKELSPEHWLDGQAACPTCRAEFCMIDVAFVISEEQARLEMEEFREVQTEREVDQ